MFLLVQKSTGMSQALASFETREIAEEVLWGLRELPLQGYLEIVPINYYPEQTPYTLVQIVEILGRHTWKT